MNIPRFFIDPKFINNDKQIIACQDIKLVKQIHKVLRLENGDRIDILDGNGNLYHCTLQNPPAQTRGFFQAKIDSTEKLLSPKQTKIIVALPLIKINRFEWALEKLTELGVDTIAPVSLHRSIIKLPTKIKNGSANKNINTEIDYKSKFIRWQKIIQEAAEQCERATPPQLVSPLHFADWLENIESEEKTDRGLRIICAERQNVESIESLLYNQKSLPSYYAIAIGAEGGFTEEEIKLALIHQFIPVSLGPLILRTETAAIYTLGLVNALVRLIQTDLST